MPIYIERYVDGWRTCIAHGVLTGRGRQALLGLPAKVGEDQRAVFEAVFQGMDHNDGEFISPAYAS